jgi:hypothetical protein
MWLKGWKWQTLYTSGLKVNICYQCLNNALVVKSLKMLTLYTRREKVKNVNIIFKWVKLLKCQHYSQGGKRLEMSIFYISDQKFKIFNIMHKWLNMSTLYTSGLKVKHSLFYTSG